MNLVPDVSITKDLIEKIYDLSRTKEFELVILSTFGTFHSKIFNNSTNYATVKDFINIYKKESIKIFILYINTKKLISYIEYIDACLNNVDMDIKEVGKYFGSYRIQISYGNSNLLNIIISGFNVKDGISKIVDMYSKELMYGYNVDHVSFVMNYRSCDLQF
jgi:hypothetical protein